MNSSITSVHHKNDDRYVVALDQGTSSSRAIVYDKDAQVVAKAQQEFTQHYPHSGWVEHDPSQIWDTQLSVLQEALKQGNDLQCDCLAG